MKSYLIIITILIVGLVSGCGGMAPVKTSPDQNTDRKTDRKPDQKKKKSTDSFYETARFIMNKAERDIYRHLPDEEARKDFIEDFWAKRDPNPETEENENRVAFNERIEYANKWFRDRPDGRGWNTERGRYLLQLGIPDERQTRVRTFPGTTWMVRTDSWYFYEYRLILHFVDLHGTGVFKLNRWPTGLSDALDKAQFVVDLKDKNAIKSAFKFNIHYHKDNLHLSIPVKRISFEEKGDRMIFGLDIEVYIYSGHKRIAHIKKKKRFDKSKQELLELKTIDIKLPYSPPQKGKYIADVIIKELPTGSRYRNTSKFKYK